MEPLAGTWSTRTRAHSAICSVASVSAKLATEVQAHVSPLTVTLQAAPSHSDRGDSIVRSAYSLRAEAVMRTPELTPPGSAQGFGVSFVSNDGGCLPGRGAWGDRDVLESVRDERADCRDRCEEVEPFEDIDDKLMACDVLGGPGSQQVIFDGEAHAAGVHIDEACVHTRGRGEAWGGHVTLEDMDGPHGGLAAFSCSLVRERSATRSEPAAGTGFLMVWPAQNSVLPMLCLNAPRC
jgi:hypothetical protein